MICSNFGGNNGKYVVPSLKPLLKDQCPQKQCSSLEACPIGKYRVGCKGSTTGTCVPCLNKPDKYMKYSSAGNADGFCKVKSSCECNGRKNKSNRGDKCEGFFDSATLGSTKRTDSLKWCYTEIGSCKDGRKSSDLEGVELSYLACGNERKSVKCYRGGESATRDCPTCSSKDSKLKAGVCYSGFNYIGTKGTAYDAACFSYWHWDSVAVKRTTSTIARNAGDSCSAIADLVTKMHGDFSNMVNRGCLGPWSEAKWKHNRGLTVEQACKKCSTCRICKTDFCNGAPTASLLGMLTLALVPACILHMM